MLLSGLEKYAVSSLLVAWVDSLACMECIVSLVLLRKRRDTLGIIIDKNP